MFIADRNALSTIYILDFPKQIPLKSFFSLNTKDIMWNKRAFSQCISCLNFVASMAIKVAVTWNMVFFFHPAFTADYYSHLAATFITLKFDNSADFRHCCRFLRFAGLKYFRHSRKATRNILRAASTTRQAGKKLTRCYFFALVDFNTPLRWQIVNVKDLTFRIFYDHLRMFISLMFYNDRSSLLALALLFNTHRLTFDYVDKTNQTIYFCKNRNTVGIPGIKSLTCLDLMSIGYLNNGTIRNFKSLEFTLFFIN